MLEKCVLTVLELNWNKRLGHKKTKLNICHHMLTSSTQLQNRSFHVVERTRTSSKCQEMKNARAKRAKNTVFHCQKCKFVGFLLPSSSWLLKLPTAIPVGLGISEIVLNLNLSPTWQCKKKLTGLHDSYSSWHLYICRFLFGLSNF